MKMKEIAGIYALKAPLADRRGEALNGKKLKLRRNEIGEMLISDAETGKPLTLTTKVVGVFSGAGEIGFFTKSKNTYEMVLVG